MLAALLPVRFAEHIRRYFPLTPIAFVQRWDDLDRLLNTGSFLGALIDPRATDDGIEAALRIIARHPNTRMLAYVEMSAANIHAVFRLSTRGLDDVFLHPVRPSDRRFQNAIEKIAGEKLASDVLAAVDSKLKQLPDGVRTAIFDLFYRPYRYIDSSDVATAAGVPIRSLYRALSKAQLPTPGELVAVAKSIHGYSLVRHTSTTIREATQKVGYSEPAIFSKHVRKHLGDYPSVLRSLPSSEPILICLIETLCKPRALRRTLRSERRVISDRSLPRSG